MKYSFVFATLTILHVTSKAQSNNECSASDAVLTGGALSMSLASLTGLTSSPASRSDVFFSEVENSGQSALEFFLNNRIVSGVLGTDSEDLFLLTTPRSGSGPQKILRGDAETIFEQAGSSILETQASLEVVGQIPTSVPALTDIVSDCKKEIIAITADGSLWTLKVGSVNNDFLDEARRIGFVPGISAASPIAYNFQTGRLMLVSNSGSTSTLRQLVIGCPTGQITEAVITPAGNCGDGDISGLTFIGNGQFRITCTVGAGATGNPNSAILNAVAVGGPIVTNYASANTLFTSPGPIPGILAISTNGNGEPCEIPDDADCVDTDSLPVCTLSGQPSQSPTPRPTMSPTTPSPSQSPTTPSPTQSPTLSPTMSPTTPSPSQSPTTPSPTQSPTLGPTMSPTTPSPSQSPTTPSPTQSPTLGPTMSPTTPSPSQSPTTPSPTQSPTLGPTMSPTTPSPSQSPTTPSPTQSPTTLTPSQPPTATPTMAPVSTTLAPTNAIDASNTACSSNKVGIAAGVLQNAIRAVYFNPASVTQGVISEVSDSSSLLQQTVYAATTESDQSDKAFALVGGPNPALVRFKIEEVFDDSDAEAELVGYIPASTGFVVSMVAGLTSDCNQQLIAVDQSGRLFNLNQGSVDNDQITPTQFSAIVGLTAADTIGALAFNFATQRLYAVTNNGLVSTLWAFTVTCPTLTVVYSQPIRAANSCGDGDITSLTYIGSGLFSAACTSGAGLTGTANVALLSIQTAGVPFIDPATSGALGTTLAPTTRIAGLFSLADDSETQTCQEPNNGCVDIQSGSCSSS